MKECLCVVFSVAEVNPFLHEDRGVNTLVRVVTKGAKISDLS